MKPIKVEDIKGDSAYEVIQRAWLGHKIEGLLPEHRAILERWQDVDRLYRRGEVGEMSSDGKNRLTKRFTWRSIVEWLVERHGISVRQAYEDVANSKRFFLFADGRTDVEYARGAALEHGRMMQWAAFDAGKFEAAAMFFKECNQVEGLHEHGAEVPDYADFQPPSLLVVADPSELGFEKIENVDEVVQRILNEKRNGFIEAEAEDVEELPADE